MKVTDGQTRGKGWFHVLGSLCISLAVLCLFRIRLFTVRCSTRRCHVARCRKPSGAINVDDPRLLVMFMDPSFAKNACYRSPRFTPACVAGDVVYDRRDEVSPQYRDVLHPDTVATNSCNVR